MHWVIYPLGEFLVECFAHNSLNFFNYDDIFVVEPMTLWKKPFGLIRLFYLKEVWDDGLKVFKLLL